MFNSDAHTHTLRQIWTPYIHMQKNCMINFRERTPSITFFGLNVSHIFIRDSWGLGKKKQQLPSKLALLTCLKAHGPSSNVIQFHRHTCPHTNSLLR